MSETPKAKYISSKIITHAFIDNDLPFIFAIGEVGGRRFWLGIPISDDLLNDPHFDYQSMARNAIEGMTKQDVDEAQIEIIF